MSEYTSRCIICRRSYDAELSECPHCWFTKANADILRDDAAERKQEEKDDLCQ